MKRYNRFKMLSNIQDKYILESMPDHSVIQTQKRRGENPIIRFFSSGWGAACICALVAIAVMAFIIQAGQNPWTPPAVTINEATETQEPDTSIETGTETEAETEPYFDPSTLDLDTYQGMTPDIPYTIQYLSNGDGTCTVNNIIINILYQGDITVEIPETSPDGETVVGMDISTNYNIPTYILAEDFEKIRSAVLAYYDFDEDNYYYEQFMSYFRIVSADFYDTQEERDKMISYYPLCEYVPICVFDPTATGVERTLRSGEIRESAPWYTAEWCYSELLKVKTVADELGVSDPNIENSLEKHSGSLLSVTDIKLPKTLKPYPEDNSYAMHINLYSIARIGIQEMSFNGTMAEMTAIADPQKVTVEAPLVIHCTDGDISYPVE